MIPGRNFHLIKLIVVKIGVTEKIDCLRICIDVWNVLDIRSLDKKTKRVVLSDAGILGFIKMAIENEIVLFQTKERAHIASLFCIEGCNTKIEPPFNPRRVFTNAVQDGDQFRIVFDEFDIEEFS